MGDSFPCKLILKVPFPTPHLAAIALRAISVDKELSPLVQRNITLQSPQGSSSSTDAILQVAYQATTNRMLRVSVNGFFEILRLVVQVMEDLDGDVAMEEGKEDLGGVQGLGEVAVGV